MNTSSSSLLTLRKIAPDLAQKLPFLRLLILFGSRATEQTHEDSDYDFALIYDPEIYRDWKKNGGSWFSLYSVFENTFGIPNESVDIVDLSRCSAILAHEIASDGKLLFEERSGEYNDFIKRSLISIENMKKIRQEQRQILDRKLQVLGV